MASNTTTSRVVKLTPAPKEEKLERLARESREILAYEAKRAGEIGYLSSTIVQCTLPYREPKGNPNAWGRTNGRVSLTIQPGAYISSEMVVDAKGRERRRNVPVSIGYPYGSIPRLLLAWVGKEVTRTRSREISLGKTLTDFMTDIGITSITGGKRGSITAVKEQTRRLFSATIALVDNLDAIDWNNDGFRLADKLSVWWDPAAPEQGSLFDSKVVLSERFFDELLRSPVPLDMRALRALKQSPLALDLYSWLPTEPTAARGQPGSPGKPCSSSSGPKRSLSASSDRSSARRCKMCRWSTRVRASTRATQKPLSCCRGRPAL